jgi:hypothetical protein
MSMATVTGEQVPGAITGFTYHNPEDPDLKNFEVVPVDPDDPNLWTIAEEYQRVMNLAWLSQFQGRYSRTQIGTTVNPSNQQLVAAQQERLRGGNRPGKPVYVMARFPVPSLISLGGVWYVAGIGKGTTADSRPRLKRLLGGTPSASEQLADISNVFVRPRLDKTPVALQARGIGSATLRTLLDAYPEDMTTVVYDYPENRRVTHLLIHGLGFHAVQNRKVDLFGTTIEQTRFDGQPVGELIAILEGKRPWLQNRQPAEHKRA